MKFNDYVYFRPDAELIAADLDRLTEAFARAKSAEEQLLFLDRINRIRNQFTTLYNLCYIRHSIDTKDAFYTAENEFFDSYLPVFESRVHSFYRALLESRFRDALEAKLGHQLFALAEMQVRSFDPAIIPDMVDENRLTSQYMQLKAKARLEVDGQVYNLSSITALEEGRDRQLRQRATDAKWGFYAGHRQQVEDIFGRLTELRTRMARKLGLNSFIPLGYMRINRADYTADDVAQFREAVRRHIVPLATKLYERQRRRIGVDRLRYYDLTYRFPSGNPRPKDDAQTIVANTAKMYRELSEPTGRFFDFMREHQLLDVEAKDGKATGGYCTFIPNYGSPFIFSNFNGTSGDIVVMTHEAGHAFQVYSSRRQVVPEYYWPTYEAAEIHSMSMEFFTFPWMELFFEQADKYRYAHIIDAMTFIPYGVAVDAFQHEVYRRAASGPLPDFNAIWREVQAEYMPYYDPAGNVFLEAGGMWQRQNHIFRTPFYYIDYTLAQMCAFQFFFRAQEDRAAAWQDYVRLCEAGGSASFLELVQLAGLESPFDENVIARIAQRTEAYLEQIDDSAF